MTEAPTTEKWVGCIAHTDVKRGTKLSVRGSARNEHCRATRHDRLRLAGKLRQAFRPPDAFLGFAIFLVLARPLQVLLRRLIDRIIPDLYAGWAGRQKEQGSPLQQAKQFPNE